MSVSYESVNGADAMNLAVASGIAVFPCKPWPDKLPLTKHGFKDATTDLDQITAWWTQWPNALVGVPTGSTNGIDAVDIDPRHNGDKWFEEHRSKIPETLVHKSQGGGIHLLFKSYPELRNSAGRIAEGVDVRGEGGYIIWWPALQERGLSEWPEWLIEKAIKKRDSEAGPSSSGQHANLLDVASALAEIPNHAKHHQQSFDDWNRVAMAVHAATGGSDPGYQLFLEWSRPHPTFSEAETRKRWDRLIGCPPKDVGAGTLFYLAKQGKQDWQMPSRRKPDAADEFEGETPADQKALLARLSINSWIKREIAPPDRLLGDLLTTTARVFLVGRTGLGKTNLAVAMAVGIATGTGFLHWRSGRPGRVLYVDGEMPPDLIRERARDAARRLSVPIPDENLFIYSAVDGEDFAGAFPALGLMPPLNTEAGHNWLKRFVGALGKVDAVIFDNVMSLVGGDQKDELPWTETLPLVQWLTAQRIGQVWLDHTGHNESRQYGSSTKAWRFDAVGILSPLNGDAEPDGALGFQLSFDHPGKARRRTPTNWRDFQTVRIRLSGDQWQYDTGKLGEQGKDRAKLTTVETDWLENIREALAGAAAGVALPLGEPFKLDQDALRERLKEMGCFTLKTSGGIADRDRKNLFTMLRRLGRKGAIRFEGKQVWIIE